MPNTESELNSFFISTWHDGILSQGYRFTQNNGELKDSFFHLKEATRFERALLRASALEIFYKDFYQPQGWSTCAAGFSEEDLSFFEAFYQWDLLKTSMNLPGPFPVPRAFPSLFPRPDQSD